MKKILKLSALFVLSLVLFQSCSDDDLSKTLSNYASFESAAYDFGIIVGDPSATRGVTVYTSSTSSSDRVFNIVVDEVNSTADPASYTVPATITIPGGSNEGILDVTVLSANLDKTLILNLEPKDGWHFGEEVTLNIRALCAPGTNEVVVSIVFDGYSDECTWDIRDDMGAIVAQVALYPGGLSDDEQIICLDDGDYTFNIYDAFGDGLSFPENGTYTVSVGVNTLVSSGGNFGFSSSHNFTLGN